MQIGKTRFVLILIGVFMGGAVLMGAVCAFIMHSSGFAIGNEDKIAKIQKYIDEYYLNDYDKNKLVEGAYKGYVEGLGDKYSSYLDADDYSSWKASTTGDYDGVGITFAQDIKGRFVVVAVEPDSPADKAGVKSGDYILKVDGKTFDDDSVMAAKIRGAAGTSVTLNIYHDGKAGDVKMTRENISVKSISHKMLDNDIGYIKISSFVQNTGKDFNAALDDVEKKGAKSLILDLRDNGGGLVDQSVEVADEFLGKGVVCYIEDKNGNTSTYDAKAGKTSLKTVVLINENSASASEILAAALKDNGFEIIGVKSFGKGVIQSNIDLGDGTGLKLTILQYLSPDKNVINKKGVKPDIKVKDKASTKADEQLDKAEEVLSQ